MRDYLLDTNILSFWFNDQVAEHQAVAGRIEALQKTEARLHISAISLGELAFGNAVDWSAPEALKRQRLTFATQDGLNTLEVKRSTAPHYGELRALLFEKFMSPDQRGSRRRRFSGIRPEQLVDPVTSERLGIQENDLWIAAQATEYNLVLATGDKMARIREVCKPPMMIEDWTRL